MSTVLGHAVRGEFDRKTGVEHFETFQFERHDTYKGYVIMDSFSSAMAARNVAVSDGLLFFKVARTHEAGRTYLRTIIDAYRGTTSRYFNSDGPSTSVVAHLPQGVFTRVYSSPVVIHDRVTDAGVHRAGQTIRIEDGDTITFRTVVRFGSEASDTEVAVESLLGDDRLLDSPVTDPAVVDRPTDRLFVIEDAGDIAALVSEDAP